LGSNFFSELKYTHNYNSDIPGNFVMKQTENSMGPIESSAGICIGKEHRTPMGCSSFWINQAFVAIGEFSGIIRVLDPMGKKHKA
jgi:hypothetical protein